MNYLKLIWGKCRLTVIIILSIVIGAIGMYDYQSFKVMKAESEATWTHVQQIQEQRKENIVDDDSVQGFANQKTESIATLEADTEDQIAVSLPSNSIEKIIYETFGEKEYKTARAVAFAESRLRANAIGKNTNGTTDCGIFQINSIHGLEDCTDPVKNIEYAKQLFDRSGWRPWVAYTTGRYLAYK